MCGLIGFSGPNGFDIDKIKTLIYINSIERGEDSTGLFSPLNGLKKSIRPGWNYITDYSTEIIEDKLLIAHVRSKTVGINSIANTHPFNRGNYCLAHNGTLNNYYALLNKYKLNSAEYNVDSDVVVGCIENVNNIAEVIKQIDGPAAFLIHDLRIKNRLYVFKNKDRPLFKGYLEGNMYISSIKESLLLIGCNKTTVKEFKDNVLYTIESGCIIKNGTKVIKNVPCTFTNNSILSKVKEFATIEDINTMVRPIYKSKYNFEGKIFELDPTKYYLLHTIDSSESKFTILDKETNININVTKFNIKSYDLLKDGDLVIALKDITSKINNSIIHYKKDEIFQISRSYQDGDFSYNYNNAVYNYCTKASIRKLNFSELDVYKNKIRNIEKSNILFKHDFNFCGDENYSNLVEYYEQLEDESKKDSEKDIIIDGQLNDLEPGIINDIETIDGELIDFFPELGSKLDDLILLVEKDGNSDEIMNKIRNMQNIIYTTYDNLYPIKKEEVINAK